MKINLKILLVFLIAFGFTVQVFGTPYSKDITLIYSGETHGMIYPCNCPIEPDGGVARRATLVKTLRKEYPDSLLLSTGGSFAGGLPDQYSQNTELDKQRSLINVEARELMKYDAVAVGDDEFNFGKEFLLNIVAKSNIPYLSANVKEGKILPYVIKEVNGIKVGITALTPSTAKQRVEDIQYLDPKESLKNAIKELRAKGANIIVFISDFEEEKDIELIEGLVKEVKGVDVVITGQSLIYKGELPTKRGDTLFLRPTWEGRRLDKATLTIKDNKIVDYKVEDIRLSDKIADDPDILNILPRCFSDANCKKEGLTGTCQNAGTMNATCTFSEPDKVNLTIVTLKNCVSCETESFTGYLKKLFPGLVVNYLYYPDSKASEMIKKFNLNALPVYLLAKNTQGEKNFSVIKDLLELKGDYYLAKPELAGVGYFIDRNETKGTLDVFLSLFDKDMSATLNVLREFNPRIHFLVLYANNVFDALKGNIEVEEDLRAVCVQKHYPNKFWDYIICRSKNIDSSWWDNCLTGVDMNKIKACARGPEGQELLKNNSKLNKEIHVMIGPTYLMDNNTIFASRGVPSKEELKKVLKR